MNVATNLAELINKTTNQSQTQPSIWCASASTSSLWLIHPLCKAQSIPRVALPFPAQPINFCNAAFFSPTTSLHAGVITCAAPTWPFSNRTHQFTGIQSPRMSAGLYHEVQGHCRVCVWCKNEKKYYLCSFWKIKLFFSIVLTTAKPLFYPW